MGIPCRHTICIRNAVSASQMLITKLDVAVVHWSIYGVHGATPVPDELTKTLVALARKDIKGPGLPEDYIELPILQEIPLKLRPMAGAESCQNYSKEDIGITIETFEKEHLCIVKHSSTLKKIPNMMSFTLMPRVFKTV